MNFPPWLERITSFLQIPAWGRVAVIALIIGLILAFAVHCRDAQAAEFEAGAGVAVVRGPAPVIDMGVVLPRVLSGSGDIRFNLMLYGTSTYRGLTQPNNFSVGTQVVNGFGPLDLGIGVTYVRNEDAYNSGGANFELSVGYHLTKAVTAEYRHHSDAGSHQPNLGRDFIMGLWRFQ